MKTKLSFLFLLSFVFYLGVAQVPQGFNYQAVARDGSGNILPGTSLQVMFYIRSLSSGGTLYWQELHTGVTTNSFGLFSLTVGTGARQAASTVATFDLIDWTVSPKWLETDIYYASSWKDMGVTQLYAVPYAMAAKSLVGAGKLGITGTTTNLEEAIFEVKNKNGQTILAVYNEGVRIYVEDGSKGTKGGFAVGGFDQSKAWNQEYLRVTGDSTRIYVNQDASKGAKGGFAVGGYDANKANTMTTYTSLTPQNYFIGHESGLKTKPTLTTGIYNSFFGYQTGKANISGLSNVFIGYQSGLVNTASYNVFIGSQSGLANTSGYNNIFIGYNSGVANTEADNNVFIGSETGFKTKTGSRNVFMGYLAGHENVSGTGNSYVGYMAGHNATGSQNSVFGYYAGYYNVGNYNVYMGPYAGRGNSAGSTAEYNVFLGNYSGYGVTTGGSNVLIGFQSGRNFTTGTGNVFLGYRAGYLNDTASYNVFLGKESGYNNKGTFNSFIGYGSGRANLGGSRNVFLGYSSGVSNTLGADNVFIGNEAGKSNTEGIFNAFVGYQTGYGNTTGDYNTLMGYRAGYSSGGSSYITAIGYLAGYSLSDWQAGTYVGYRAGQYNTGRTNVMVGSSAGYTISTGADNVLVGGGAGGNYDASADMFTGSSNVMIGKYAGFRFFGGSSNVYLGASAGSDATGSRNIFIGPSAGQNNTESDLLIIDNAGGGATSALIYGDLSSDLLRFNASVGINAAPGTAKLYVVDNNTAIGVRGDVNWAGTTSHYGIYGYGAGSTNFNHGAYGSASGGSQAFGVWGIASGASSYNIGVYGSASGTGNNAGYFAGNVTVTGTFTNPSDINLKKDITPLLGALDRILKVQGVSFLWKSEQELDDFLPNISSDDKMGVHEKFNFPEGKQIGVIAQDVEQVFPELVQADADGIKSVDYIKMIPVLIEAIKEQQKQINLLNAEIEQLKNK